MDFTNGQVIIGVTGRAGCGKSEVGKHLHKQAAFITKKLAGPLKDMVEVILRANNVLYIDEHIEGMYKEEPLECLGGKSVRHLMQTLGTEWGRDCIKEDFWISTWKNSIIQFPRIVVDDIRFDNEAEAIRDMGGQIIHIVRNDPARNPGDHASERGVEPLSSDLFIRNNGSIAELQGSLNYILQL